MARLDELHALITSLSQGEKRHFRRLLADLRKPGESQAIQLFDLLLRYPEYGKDGLMEKIHEAGLERHLATTIPRLNSQVLKSVVHLRAEQNVDAKLYQALAEIKVLYGKHLYAQGMRMIKNARKVAREYSRSNIELELLSWERRFFIDSNPQATDEHLGKLRKEGQRLADLLQLQMTLRQMQSEARAAHRKGLSAANHATEIGKFWRPELFSQAIESGDGLAGLLAGSVQGIYHTLQQDHASAYEVLLEVMRLWEGKKNWVEDKAELLLIVFNNFFYAGIVATDDQGEIEHYLNLIRRIKFQDPVLQFRTRRIVYQQEFIYCLNFARRERGQGLAHRISSWLPEVKDRLSVSQWIMFHYNLTIFHFLSGNLSGAGRTIQEIKGLPAGPVRNDARRVAAILHILVQYQYGHVDLCEPMLRNAKRNFGKQVKRDHPHLQVLEHCSGIIKALPGKELNQRFSGLIELFDQLPPFLGQQEVRLWALSHLNGSTIWDEFRALVKAHQAAQG